MYFFYMSFKYLPKNEINGYIPIFKIKTFRCPEHRAKQELHLHCNPCLIYNYVYQILDEMRVRFEILIDF